MDSRETLFVAPEGTSPGKWLEYALGYIHDQRILHLDLSPNNIMIDRLGVPRIMDFGLAKFRGSVQLTQIGTTVGTVAYMSPEQALGQLESVGEQAAATE